MEKAVEEFNTSVEQKYGKDGIKGKRGEERFASYLKLNNIKYKDYSSDIRKQTAGIDFVVNDELVDVKANDGIVELEHSGWLFSSNKCTDIFVFVLNEKEMYAIRAKKLRQLVYEGKHGYPFISGKEKCATFDIRKHGKKLEG